MRKIIREVDEERGITQITVADERWYTKPAKDEVTGMPIYKPVPSITWIASYWPKGVEYFRWLAQKGWDEAEAIKVEAGEKGSVVHSAIEMILHGLEFRIDTKVVDRAKSTEQETYERELTYDELLCVQSFIDWRTEMEKEWTIRTISNESTLISDIHGCAGTTDWVIELTHKKSGEVQRWVIDFKTSKAVRHSHKIQVNAYRVMLENGENPIFKQNANGTESREIEDLSGLRMGILLLGYSANKNGYKFTEIEDLFEDFKVAQAIWRRENGKNTPGFSVRDFPIVLSRAQDADLQPAEIVSNVEVTDIKILGVEDVPVPISARKKLIKVGK